MEVILMEDIEALGHEGDVVRVADGHARNYLIPSKLAVEATKAARAELERRRGGIVRREEQKAEKAQQLAGRLHENPLVIEAKGGEGGRLHGTVTAQHIAEALAEQARVTVDRRRIQLLEPIREVGDYLVAAQLYKGVTAQLTITVKAEGGEEAQEEPEEEPAEEPAEEPSEEAAAEADEEKAEESEQSSDAGGA
jgi:large subunit ribosomal protein L9